MRTWKLKSFPNGSVADDGSSVTLVAEFEDGRTRDLVIPFAQLDWAVQALLRLNQGAYERSVSSGKLPPPGEIDAEISLVVEGLRAMPNTQKQHILVQMMGRAANEAPLGAGSFIINEELALHLARRLHECVDQIRQSSKLS